MMQTNPNGSPQTTNIGLGLEVCELYVMRVVCRARARHVFRQSVPLQQCVRQCIVGAREISIFWTLHVCAHAACLRRLPHCTARTWCPLVALLQRPHFCAVFASSPCVTLYSSQSHCITTLFPYASRSVLASKRTTQLPSCICT